MIFTFSRWMYFLFVLILPNPCWSLESIPPVQLSDIQGWSCLENNSLYQLRTDTLTDVRSILSQGKFEPYEYISPDSKTQAIWMIFEIESEQSSGDSLHINCKFYDEVRLYEIYQDSSSHLLNTTGYLPQYFKSKKWNSIISFHHPKQTRKTYLLALISHTRNSKMLSSYFTSNCAKIYSDHGFRSQYRLPQPLLFFFFGGILMMSLYNLGIALSTHYREYILFSIYNFCFVLLGINFSNLHIELDWVTPFDLERNLRFTPAIIGIAVYLLFSISFLDLKKLNFRLYQILWHLFWIFPIMLLGIFLSYFTLVFIVFTALMPPLFMSILYASWCRARSLSYARYFLAGNILLISVGLLQLLSLYGLISVVHMSSLTIIALMLEVILFSFAVAIKQKVTKKELYLMQVKNQLQRERIEYELDLKQKLEIEIEKKSRTLTSSSVQWLNLTDQLTSLKKKLKKELKETDEKLYKEILKQIEEIENFEDQWNSFKLHFENVYRGFFERIEKNYPMLSQNDLKICAFMKMKLSNKEMAQILNVTKKAIEQSKRRMRKKIGLESDCDLLEYLEQSLKPEMVI
ncbi:MULTISPECIES: 7TM diverse intracellular signaling domain-containing protein [Reichenbachiella]|uniref:7TM diverse intracellular signaling domain-containing protein n=1 Tax=Reichenbachiella TaxID=156993 RepID=UPI000E6B6728|nr:MULTISPECIES: 7TM diverse intracellular signaling domain-containing protein [Reichenbachiella]MBU2912872.1 hypothetical protein [Reichenbachiella agariperforans]